MKRITAMFFLCLAITISGCKTLEQEYKRFMEYEPETLQEKNDREQREQSIKTVINQFNGGYPLEIKYQQTFLDESQYQQIKTKFDEAYKKGKLILENPDSTAKEIRRVYDEGQEVPKVAKSSLAFMEHTIDRASYDPYFTETFYVLHENYSEYRDWLKSLQSSFEELAPEAFQMGVKKEGVKFITDARQQGCKYVEGLNFLNGSSLAQIIAHGREQLNAKMVYDLGDFVVLQNAPGGVLLRPGYTQGLNSNPIFMRTNKTYADGTYFKQGEQAVCFDGEFKKYTSVLGSPKTVYEIKPIENSTKYYFLPW